MLSLHAVLREEIKTLRKGHAVLNKQLGTTRARATKAEAQTKQLNKQIAIERKEHGTAKARWEGRAKGQSAQIKTLQTELEGLKKAENTENQKLKEERQLLTRELKAISLEMDLKTGKKQCF